MRRGFRILGTLMVAGGLCLLVWAAVVWRWQDPVTALYTAYQQHRLAARYEDRLAAYRPPPLVTAQQPPVSPPSPLSPASPNLPRKPRPVVLDEERRVAIEARSYRRALGIGAPIGRLKVPRLGVNVILVNGTDRDTLTKGPGRYPGSFLPGEGQLVYIAGHRTTYGAPFAQIEELRTGDEVTIELPYGTFVYRIRRHAVVSADDVSQLRSRGREVVALQACHPRFFATQRYIAYAQPVRVILRSGRAYVPKAA